MFVTLTLSCHDGRLCLYYLPTPGIASATDDLLVPRVLALLQRSFVRCSLHPRHSLAFATFE